MCLCYLALLVSERITKPQLSPRTKLCADLFRCDPENKSKLERSHCELLNSVPLGNEERIAGLSLGTCFLNLYYSLKSKR